MPTYKSSFTAALEKAQNTTKQHRERAAKGGIDGVLLNLNVLTQREKLMARQIPMSIRYDQAQHDLQSGNTLRKIRGRARHSMLNLMHAKDVQQIRSMNRTYYLKLVPNYLEF
jgi:hypothetical protein